MGHFVVRLPLRYLFYKDNFLLDVLMLAISNFKSSSQSLVKEQNNFSSIKRLADNSSNQYFVSFCFFKTDTQFMNKVFCAFGKFSFPDVCSNCSTASEYLFGKNIFLMVGFLKSK